jgi:hypothetical protein
MIKSAEHSKKQFMFQINDYEVIEFDDLDNELIPLEYEYFMFSEQFQAWIKIDIKSERKIYPATFEILHRTICDAFTEYKVEANSCVPDWSVEYKNARGF